jgi:MFS family permease
VPHDHPATWVERFTFYSVRFLSQAGQGIFLAALFLAAGRGSHGALGLSTIFVATLSASLLFGLPGGALADRIGPARALALGGLLRLSVISATLLIVHHHSWLWAAAFAYSAVSQAFTPAELALVARIRRGGTARTHSVLTVLQYAGQGTGMLVLYPALLLLGGPVAALSGAATLYVVVFGVALVLAVRMSRTRASWPALGRHGARLIGTFGFFRREPAAGYAVVLITFADMATKGAAIAGPRLCRSALGLTGHEEIALSALAAAGTVAGLVWATRWLTGAMAGRVMRLALIGIIASLLTLVAIGGTMDEMAEHTGVGVLGLLNHSSRANLLAAAPAIIVLGFFLAAAPIAARATLSDTAPRDQQARVFACQALISHAAVLLPLLLAGAGTQVAGPRVTLLAIGVVGMVLFVALEAARMRRTTPSLQPVLVVVEAAVPTALP